MARRPPLARPLLSLLILGGLTAGCLPAGTRGSGSASAVPIGSVEVTAPTSSPGPTGPTSRPSFVAPTPTPAPTFLVYVVARGDNLNTIARKFGTTARSIAFWNRATYPHLDPEAPGYRPDLLQVGWTLFLIPDDVVNEEELPGPTPAPAEPSESTGT
jgi:nucleoid-associated protein YgaU